MLELRDICKEYHTGDTVQKALDHVSLTLQDTGFVAILGPSGSGKTTLLNIIGGLDRYDRGDLIIDGISTKDYSDRDWDAYRNHAIGFVFQSYNLIAHQSVLANVELALTIGGISGEERKQRAEEALRRVGLGDHMHKKPGQLSGGQMQRVAIARALVNNPRIVLADEPTGALDSDTSIQVMDILREVSIDHLVVMVTHNPELAERYATRIVTIRDGRFAGSRELPQNQIAPAEKKPLEVQEGRGFHHTSMSFLTALALSFQNLRTKKARTFMVAFAGSIGIIGIALILAIETGLQQYVQATESATLSQYPIEIYATGIDWTSLLSETSGLSNSYSGMTGNSDDGEEVRADSDEIVVNTLAKDIFTGINNNDLYSFKKYLESGKSDIGDYATDIEYNYGVEPQIYDIEEDGTIEQLNPNRMLSDMLTSIIDVSSLMDGIVGESLFHAMPSDESLYKDSYDVKAGRWPENNHELVLVLTADGRISDFMLYELGIKDPDELREMISQFSSGSSNSILDLASRAASVVGSDDTENAQTADSSESGGENDDNAVSAASSEAVASSSEEETETCTYSDFIGHKFKLILASDTYLYDDDLKVWSDQSDDKEYMDDLVKNGEDLEIVGIVQAKEGASNQMLMSGLGYPRDLITEIISRESESDPVRAQLADPETDILTGRKFSDDSGNAFDFSDMISLDHDDVAKAFHVTTDAASSDTVQDYLSSEIDKMTDQIVQYAAEEAESEMQKVSLSDFIDVDALQDQIPQLTEEDITSILNAAFSDISEEAVKKAVKELGSSYISFLEEDLRDNAAEQADDSELIEITKSLWDYIGSYLESEEARAIIQDQLRQMMEQNAGQISTEIIQTRLQEEIQAYTDWVGQNNTGRETEELLNAEDPTVIALYLASPEGQQRISALGSWFSGFTLQVDGSQLQELSDALLDSFNSYASQHELPDLEAISEELTGNLTDSLTRYLKTDGVAEAISSAVAQMMSGDALRNAVSAAVQEKVSGLTDNVSRDITDRITQAAEKEIVSFADDVAGQAKQIVISTISEDYPEIANYINQNIGDFFTVNQEAFRKAIKVNAGLPELQSLLTSFLNSDQATLAGNLSSFGYADLDSPVEIMIYPKDFDAKNTIADLIEQYNEEMKDNGNDDKVISYSDVVATMMQSVTDIINAISRILIAFVSISLVVSSIMIGVITYISVLERKKEIGILRAIGASKHNIREVFNAETVIIGLISGCLGIGITVALIPFANIIIHNKTGQIIRAVLPPEMAAALVLLSVLLTLLAGLFPSGKAARSDPVEALRSE